MNEAFSRAGMVRAFAWANNRRKVVASWLQRPPTSMASTTSLQRRVVFRPWWNREQFRRHTESMHHVSHRLRPILAIRTRPTIDRNILGCDTLMLSNCTFVKSSQVKSSQVKSSQTCTPISAGPFRAQAQNVSNCSPNMLHKGESSHRQRMQTEKHGWRGNCIDELQSQFQNHVLVCKYGPMFVDFCPEAIVFFLSFARSSHLDPKRTWETFCSSHAFTIFYKCCLCS